MTAVVRVAARAEGRDVGPALAVSTATAAAGLAGVLVLHGGLLVAHGARVGG